MFTSLLDLWVLGSTIAQFVLMFPPGSDPQTNLGLLGQHPASIVIMLFTFVLGLTLSSLWIYHCYLVYQNLTTHEQMRNKFSMRGPTGQGTAIQNPFDLGGWRNIREVLFQKLDDGRYAFKNTF